MKKLFDTHFYVHFKAPNADELISFLNEKNEINKEEFDDVSFVPMLPGISEDGNEL